MDRYRAANYALLVMYAWDMCDTNLRTIPPVPDPRIAGGGLTIRGYITGSDDIVRFGPNIRSTMLGSSDDPRNRVCYGYVADSAAETIAVIRGTDGAEEWADDFDFLMVQHEDTAAGLVDDGFYSIYRSMQYYDPATNTSMPLVDIAAVAAGKPLIVLGHSLGAALGTYLTLDLKRAGAVASACLFASPHPGNSQFALYFDSMVGNYDVFNYERDLVPKVPIADAMHFSRYVALPQAKIIPASAVTTQINDELHCNHHLICYIALLDPDTYRTAVASAHLTTDDRLCARCVLNLG